MPIKFLEEASIQKKKKKKINEEADKPSPGFVGSHARN